MKGNPIPAFEQGRLYVVEFWATWCGPCRAAMPHLSELARTYADRVEIIEVNILEKNPSNQSHEAFYPSIQDFVANMGSKMAYDVARGEGHHHCPEGAYHRPVARQNESYGIRQNDW